MRRLVVEVTNHASMFGEMIARYVIQASNLSAVLEAETKFRPFRASVRPLDPGERVVEFDLRTDNEQLDITRH